MAKKSKAQHSQPTATPSIVVQKIEIKSNARETQDIKKWRDAIKAAENRQNPVRARLYDLYEDIMLDGHLTSVVEKRKLSVVNNDLIFKRDGKEDEEINKILNSPDMVNLLTDLIDTVFWGHTLIQILSVWWDEERENYRIEYKLIPRKHVHPEDDFQCISASQNSVTRDFIFTQPPLSNYMIWAGRSNDLGLLQKAAQYVIYKRGDFGDWAQFAELFGMPFREARYDEYDDATRIELEKMMELYGGAGYAILPKKAEFNLHQASTAASSNVVYKDLKDACNQELSVLVLGQTLTTTQGENGARSLGEIHQDSEDNIMAADRKFIIGILNDKFKAILKLFGFNVSGGAIEYLEQINLDKLAKKAAIIAQAKQMVPVSDDYIYEELGIPKPENYEQLKAEQLAAQQQILPTNETTLNNQPANFLRRFFG